MENNLNRDITKEVDVFKIEKKAMISQAMMLFEDVLDEHNLELLRISFSNVWNNGFRYGSTKNHNI